MFGDRICIDIGADMTPRLNPPATAGEDCNAMIPAHKQSEVLQLRILFLRQRSVRPDNDRAALTNCAAPDPAATCVMGFLASQFRVAGNELPSHTAVAAVVVIVIVIVPAHVATVPGRTARLRSTSSRLASIRAGTALQN